MVIGARNIVSDEVGGVIVEVLVTLLYIVSNTVAEGLAQNACLPQGNIVTRNCCVYWIFIEPSNRFIHTAKLLFANNKFVRAGVCCPKMMYRGIDLEFKIYECECYV